MPQISVIIPTKGRPDLLMRAVGSALGQTLSDLEVIVVVDGDDPETIVRLGSVADRRLNIIVNQTSLGAAMARNVGAQSAVGQWLAFLDDDDEWSPKKLEEQLSLVRSDDINVIVTCLTQIVTPFGQSIRPKKIYDNSGALSEWLFDRRTLAGGEGFIQTSSLVMPKSLFDKFQFRPSAGEHDDWDLLLRAASVGAKIITAPESLVRCYIEEQRARLTGSYKLEQSLEWAKASKGIITPRAYSGFCLTVAAQRARMRGRIDDFIRLLWLACWYGAPTAMQLLIYFGIWLLPVSVRRKIGRFAVARQS